MVVARDYKKVDLQEWQKKIEDVVDEVTLIIGAAEE
jgi:hypothetical protein